MVIFLNNQYIFVWIHQFWGLPLNCLIFETILYLKLSYNKQSYKKIPVYLLQFKCIILYDNESLLM